MRVAIAADHAGFELKRDLAAHLSAAGHQVLDLGTNGTAPVDYPDYAEALGHALEQGQAERGILLCGSGVGASVAANKLPAIRAGLCHDTYSAHQGVEHDNMNVLVLGARVIGSALALELVNAFLAAKFSGAERHVRRLQKIAALEARWHLADPTSSQSAAAAPEGAPTVNPLRELQQQGQSIWLDYIRRNLIVSGELKRLVEEDGLSGITSNPTIFDKAIAGSADYDDALRQLLANDAQLSPQALFERLEVEDIQMAADVLRPVFDRTSGNDGFVSIEVRAELAHDTQGSIAEARRLWKAVNRPNLMVKIPSTAEGIHAIEALIAGGINVNITLMFSQAHYEAVAQAYLRGLRQNQNPSQVRSVASFFVSRVDTEVDRLLQAIGTPEALALRGRAGIANCKRVYRRFRELFLGAPFEEFKARGAHLQRVLWASTSTKNPAYSDVMYVEELIGPHTINTLPPGTLNAFREHGRVRPTLESGLREAEAVLAQIANLGIDLNVVGEKLLEEGLAKFSESFEKLLASLEQKRAVLLGHVVDRQQLSLGPLQKTVEERLTTWDTAQFSRRFAARDHTLWSAKPVPELTDRMGWLNLPETMHERIGELQSFADTIRDEGITHAVLLGMGGSSLAPRVFQDAFGNAPGYPQLLVLDSTHPAAVRDVEKRIDLSRTLFLVSSKSGTTLETLSLFRYFWARVGGTTKAPGERFVAITDPGTPLAALAYERGFRVLFHAPRDVGGRYSMLTVFGLVPAALIGVDLKRFLDEAWTMAEATAFCVQASASPGLELGAALGELARAGYDKLTFIGSPALAAFPIWLEQLVAESTGKDGKGIVPVADEPLGSPDVYGSDRVFACLQMDDERADPDVAALQAAGCAMVRLTLRNRYDLAQEAVRWEVAIAAAGSVLGINPFDQPDVELAKQLARKAMADAQATAGQQADAVPISDAARLTAAIESWWAQARKHDYVGLQAYLAPAEETTKALQEMRRILRDRSHLATTAGYGPRFLHSTGQLHKGGPNTGLFLQLLDEPTTDLPVPETNYSFGALIRAQALGDYQALQQRGRRVLRIQLGGDTRSGLRQLTDLLSRLQSPRGLRRKAA